jgi:hypothetical protein
VVVHDIDPLAAQPGRHARDIRRSAARMPDAARKRFDPRRYTGCACPFRQRTFFRTDEEDVMSSVTQPTERMERPSTGKRASNDMDDA